MTLAYGQALWGLVLVPVLVIAFALDGQHRRRLLERIGHLAQIRRMTASVSVGRRRLKAIMLVLAIALLVGAVARPQRPGVAHMLPRRGLDIVVALDFSRSMLAADVYPNRLQRAKFELSRLIDGLKGDRVGLVAFAGVTLSYPLTNDYAAAKLFWRDLGPADIPVGGTNLGEAIRAGVDLLTNGHRQAAGDARKPAQVIVLLTDGADTEGAALSAAREAAKKGIKIFPVGIGSREGEVVVLKKKDDGTAEYVTDPLGTPVRMVLDEETLAQIAKETSGEYFKLDPERFGVDGVQKAIAGLERVEEEGRVVREPEEAYGWFLAPALALLVLETVVGERRRKRRTNDASDSAAPSTDDAGDPNATSDVTSKGRRRLGGRRRAVDAGAVLMLALLPLLGGWTPFSRLSPDVVEGNEKLAAGKANDALAAYDRALAARPDDLSIHFDRGAALYALGKLPEAEREFERATESTDASLRADAYYNMGNARLKRQQPKDAIDAYVHALKLRPDDRRAKWNLELALRLLDQQQQKQQQQKDKQQESQNDKQQKQNEQQQQEQNKEDQKDPKQDQKQNEAKQDENKPDQKDPKQQDAKNQPKPGGNDKQQQQQQQQQQAKNDQQNPSGAQGEQKPEQKPDKQDEKPQNAQGATAAGKRDIDKQDAEAVLDAFERVEPTVQKDLARRRAKNARPRKDW
jgi:Ca-activated chloride channel family protein